MARRTYHQFCSLARSLDIVGERWTLLVVRELMAGPKRYVDLSDALDGIGSSLLAGRLRQLEEDDIVRRRQLPPPAAALVYELTDTGAELAEALLPLMLWGARHRTQPPRPDESYRAEWALVFIAQLIDRAAIGAADFVYEFRLADSSAYLRVHAGEVTVTAGPLDHADAVVRSDPETVAEISAGRIGLHEAVTDGHIALEGNPEALAMLVQLLPERIPGKVRIVAG
jgi:DNA-binding HxlR family transcriptional regulator